MHSKWSILGDADAPMPEAPNPHGMNAQDNALNSPDQQAAVQNWFGLVEDSAKQALREQGCPDPDGVLEQYRQQQPDMQVDGGSADLTDVRSADVFDQPAANAPPTPTGPTGFYGHRVARTDRYADSMFGDVPEPDEPDEFDLDRFNPETSYDDAVDRAYDVFNKLRATNPRPDKGINTKLIQAIWSALAYDDGYGEDLATRAVAGLFGDLSDGYGWDADTINQILAAIPNPLKTPLPDAELLTKGLDSGSDGDWEKIRQQAEKDMMDTPGSPMDIPDSDLESMPGDLEEVYGPRGPDGMQDLGPGGEAAIGDVVDQHAKNVMPEEMTPLDLQDADVMRAPSYQRGPHPLTGEVPPRGRQRSGPEGDRFNPFAFEEDLDPNQFRQASLDPSLMEAAVAAIDAWASGMGGNGSWTPKAVNKARQELVREGYPQDQVDQVLNQLVAETWEEGHATGQNEYFGPEQQWPAGYGESGQYYAKQAKYDGHWKPGDKKHLKGEGETNDKANKIYHAIGRESGEDEMSDEEKSDAAAIAWSQAEKGKKKHDKDDDKDDKDKDDKKKSKSYAGVVGRVTARWIDMWTEKEMVRFATEYGTFEVPAEELVDAEAPSILDPLHEIESFVDGLEPAGSTVASMTCRIANLTTAADACKKVIATNVSDKAKRRLDEIGTVCRLEAGELKKTLASTYTDEEREYVSSRPRFSYEAVEQAPLGVAAENDDWLGQVHNDMVNEAPSDFGDFVTEEPALLVNDLPDAVVADAGATREIALSRVDAATAGLAHERRASIREEFLANTEKLRQESIVLRKRRMARTAKATTTKPLAGPDELLFL